MFTLAGFGLFNGTSGSIMILGITILFVIQTLKDKDGKVNILPFKDLMMVVGVMALCLLPVGLFFYMIVYYPETVNELLGIKKYPE